MDSQLPSKKLTVMLLARNLGKKIKENFNTGIEVSWPVFMSS